MSQQLKAVAFVRMSTAAQATSPDRQRQLFSDYCDRWGLQPVGEFSDLGVSATSTDLADREGITALLAAARKKRFDLVWVEETSRLARKPEDWFALRAALGKSVVAIVDSSDDPRAIHDSSIREFTQGLFALLNRFEARNLGDRIKRAQQVNVANGKYRGGPLPPGLAWDAAAQGYVLDEASQPFAVRAFELFAECRCFQQVAKRMTAEGYLSRKGNPLSQPAVRTVLKNSVYRGQRRFGSDLYPTDVPQIVPAPLVAQVDAILQQQKERPNRATHDYVSRALFAGLLKCPHCGGWLQVHYFVAPSGKAYIAYKCHRSRTLPVTCDWRTLVSELSFAKQILPAIHRQMASIPVPEAARARRQERQRQGERERVEAEKQRVIALHQRGRLAEEETDRLLDEIAARMATIEQPVSVVTVTPEQVRALAKRQAWPVLTVAERRALLQEVIAYIVPKRPWGESEVVWRV